jgi:excisionase family DNA binding protein
MQLSKKDITTARNGLLALSDKRKRGSKSNSRLVIGTERAANPAEINLPPQAVEALTKVLEHLAEGREVIISARPEEFSTQQAAEYLNVSRPFLVGLLEKGEILFRRVGTHRRVLFTDLKNYKEKIDAQRLKTLEALAEQAQELGLGY